MKKAIVICLFVSVFLTIGNSAWLNVSYQSPASGNSQNLNQNNTFNVSMNVTCIGGDCGTVTAALKYNDSNGLNPDTNVSTTLGATPFYVMTSSGSHIFLQTNVTTTVTAVQAVDIGDADNNGINDVVLGMGAQTTNVLGNQTRMYTNMSGTWVETNISVVQRAGIYSVAVGDGDNDGQNEVFAGFYGFTAGPGNQSRMYKNTSGTWVETNLSDDWGATTYVYAVDVGDVNNDGSNEVIFGGVAGAVKWYNYTGGTWVQPSGSFAPCTSGMSTIQALVIGDANNDGLKDFTIGSYGVATPELRLCENKTGKWVGTNISSVTATSGIIAIAVGDADNDGLNEIVFSPASGSDNSTKMVKNMSGTWVETNISTAPSNAYTGLNSIAIGDMNNDGKNEVFVGLSGGNNRLRIYENRSGGWVETNLTSSPPSVSAFDGISIGDVDNDGKNEAAVGIGTANIPNVIIYSATLNPLSCGPMPQGDICQLNWTVNATGAQNMQYWLDANFTSTVTAANDSGDFQINIGAPAAPTLPPNVSFVPPTETSGSTLDRKSAYVNVSANGTSSLTVLVDWNRSLVGWWRLNNESGENSTFFKDWSTYKNNGTCMPATCPNYTMAGRFGGAYSFNGSTYADAGSSTTLEPPNNITITLWIKPNSLSDQKILWKGVAHGGYGIHYSPGLLLTIQMAGWLNWYTGKNLVADEWQQIAVTFNRPEVKLYYNGTYIGNTSRNADNSGGRELYIGGWEFWTAEQGYHPEGSFNGTIDDVQIYNRALSAEEINASYNATTYRYQHNFTGLANGNYTFRAYAQDGNGNVNQTEERNVTIAVGSLNVSYQSPASSSSQRVSKNNTFNVSINVTCLDASCGTVTGVLRYNNSAGLNPDTTVSNSTGTTPFYVISSANPKSCGSMTAGQTCQLNWIVNATATTDAQYWLDINFTSDKPDVAATDSGNFQIDFAPITQCTYYINCNDPNCLHYSDKITAIISSDSSQKIWSRIRKCWS